VLQLARASKARYDSGKPLSIFDGVPVAVKAELDIAGYITTLGTKFLPQVGSPAKENAHVVQTFVNAGAVIIGHANMHEFGVGVTGMNCNTGFPRNPYNIR